MVRLSRAIRHLVPCAVVLCTLLLEAARFLRGCLRSPAALAAENLFLRKQLALYQARHVKPRHATNAIRMALVWLSQWFDWQPALAVVQPETFQRWRRQGCYLFWRDPSCPGRPAIPVELQRLIRQMALDNVTWGQRRIANELRLKLGLQVSPRTVHKYMFMRFDRVPGQRMPSQCWRTFMRNHAWDLIVRGVYAELTQGVQAWFGWIRWSLQRWQGRCVTSSVQGIPTATDTVAMALVCDTALGLVVWSAVAVEVRRMAERSPPAAMALSCLPHHGPPTRAIQVDTVGVHPAGAVLDGWNRARPPARCVQHLHKGGTLAVLWLRAA
jgi:hypothetical protein